MKQNAIISIRGRQMMPEFEEPDVVELITPGVFCREGGDYLITYLESELTGLGGTTTTLRVEGGRVILSRMGEVSTHMIFEQGTRHLSYYDTGEGPFTVGVSARSVKSFLTEKGGHIEVDYEIEIDQAITGENNISVKIESLPS